MFDFVLRHTPHGETRRRMTVAAEIPSDASPAAVAGILGNGSLITAPDTVPFCLWMAANRSANFVQAIADTISVGGDCDTNAAIVGGIVALTAGGDAMPSEWLAAREAVRF
jgi:ADP-ribosylglycohydrolase